MRTAAAHSRFAVPARLLAEFIALAGLLFVTRFILRGYLAPQMDQECHIGGVAIDVLAHGIRFPFLAYAPNEYDNGSLFSGLLAAVSFTLLGRSVLALKLVTHLISAAGAVATLWILRACLDEQSVTSRRARWSAIAVLVVAIALAPRIVTALAMYAVGNHTEGTAIDMVLLALFSYGARTRTPARTGVLWALAGLALYLNKGTVLVLPVLAITEVALARLAPRRGVAAIVGFGIGLIPEALVVAQRHGMGWEVIAGKAESNSRGFPYAFLESVWTLAEQRVTLLAIWALALISGIALVFRRLWAARNNRPATVPIALAMVLGVACLHLAELAVMGKSGLDQYVIYGYPPIGVLVALLVGRGCASAEQHWGAGAATACGTAAVGLACILYRPEGAAWDTSRVAALWHNRAGAACSWRFAEGFEREQENGLAPPGRMREQHAVERCRSLIDSDQQLDCIGGIARELTWRHNGRVSGTPPDGLNPAEQRAYAFYYGTHRRGDATPCSDFAAPALAAECTAAVQLDCLIYADLYTRFSSSRRLARPRCAIPEPPMDGYWAAMRLDLLDRIDGRAPDLSRATGDDDLRACAPVFDLCYRTASDR